MGTDDPLLRPVKDGNTFEQTVERLATAIRMGVVETGGRLPPERDLADQLNVSRVTLREAIKALNQAGYVMSTRGRTGGTVVTYDHMRRPAGDAAPRGPQARARRPCSTHSPSGPSSSRARPSSRRAATLDPIDRDRLLAALERCNEADGPTRRVADSRLHVLIGELSGSPSVAASVADVQGRLDALLAAIPVFDRNIAHSDHQHAACVKAIVKGRPDVARAEMSEHVAGTAHLLRGLLT